MRAQETSAKALKEIQERGDDVSLQRRVVAALLQEGPMPRRTLARHLGMEDRWSSVTARVRELLDLGVVYEQGREEDPETGAQGAVVHPNDRAGEWLVGDWDPDPPDRSTTDDIKVSEEFLSKVEDCIDNPGSLTDWMDLKNVYEEEIGDGRRSE